MLSEVERSVKNPTVKLAWEIARALECSLTDLVEEAPAPEVTIVRAAEIRTLVDPETGVERHGVLTSLLSHGLEVVTYDLPARASSGAMAPNRPGVVEHIVVTRGTLCLRVGDGSFKVKTGDHVTYAPQSVVEYVNEGARPCAFLLLSDRSQAS